MPHSSTVVATFNLHAGIDGFGRHYDVVEACGRLEADVLVLQEVFGTSDGKSQAAQVATSLGYQLSEAALSPAWRRSYPFAEAEASSWEPRRPYPRAQRALRVGSYLRSAPDPTDAYEEGTWGIAVCSREPVVSVAHIDLGRLKRDFCSRAALVVRLESGLTVVGTHMSHFSHGSLVQMERLRRALPDSTGPAVLAGDMNFWGPPIQLALPGWKRLVQAKSWPARRPRHQLDHIFGTKVVSSARTLGSSPRLSDGTVLTGNSDHLPIRVEISYQSPRHVGEPLMRRGEVTKYAPPESN